MHIAWLVPHLQLFGAIREMVEVCNVMVAHGHQVTIYTPTGEPCAWLTCRATVQRVSDLIRGTGRTCLSASLTGFQKCTRHSTRHKPKSSASS